MIDFVKPAAFLPEDARKAIDDAREGLKTGTLAVFKGPIVDNTGKEVLAKDAVADDAWKGAIKLLREGRRGEGPLGQLAPALPAALAALVGSSGRGRPVAPGGVLRLASTCYGR